MSDEVAGDIDPRRLAPRWTSALALLAIVALGLALYLPGVWWGLPATTSWSQDTIAGMRTIGPLENQADGWRGRYPPLHYHLLGAIYKPVLDGWVETGERTVDPQTRVGMLSEPHAPKMGRLFLLARLVSVAMAILGGIGLWMAARVLIGCDGAALIATVAIMLGAAYTYFAQTGNVDVPSLCWFNWSLFFYARSLRTRRALDALLLGLFGAAAISTKDALAGLYPGMAIVLLLNDYAHHRQSATPSLAICRAWFQWRWLMGATLFAMPYLWLYGAFDDFGGYVDRMGYWLAPATGTLHGGQVRYASQPAMMLATLRYAAAAVGWPMLAAMGVAIVHAGLRNRRLLLFTAAPAATYYLLVLSQIYFVYSRFLLGVLALASILVGHLAVAIWRRDLWPRPVRAAVLLMIFLPSAGSAAFVSVSKHRDTRYAAEAWFVQNVPRPSSVGAFSDAQYLPRLHDQGYATFPVKMSRRSFDRPQPEFLVLTSYNYEDFDEPQRDCMRDLVAGRLGYEQVAEFRPNDGDPVNWLGLAGRGTPTLGKISPTITVLRRDDS